jgi:hypothetical protein
MTLGQMMMVTGAMMLLGVLVLNANRTVLETNDIQNTSEFGITAVSLATSLVEEANGKMFDQVIADSTTPALTSPTQLSASLQKDVGETYRGAKDFNDFDDFNGLLLVFRNPIDSTVVSGVDKVITVPGIRALYTVRCRVNYVNPSNLDSVSLTRSWHKKLTVTVRSPSFTDSLVYPTIMSYWN